MGKLHKSKWSKKQYRAHQMLQTMFDYWTSRGYHLKRVDLTSAPGSNYDDLAYNARRLRQEVERKYGYKDIQHFTVKTREGHGVLHMVWAWKPPEHQKERPFFLRIEWLQKMWKEIHGAHKVWIANVGSGSEHSKKIARYFANQYVAGQDAFDRYFWSWGRTGGLIKIPAYRKLFMDYYVNHLRLKPLVARKYWRDHVRGDVVHMLQEKTMLAVPLMPFDDAMDKMQFVSDSGVCSFSQSAGTAKGAGSCLPLAQVPIHGNIVNPCTLW